MSELEALASPIEWVAEQARQYEESGGLMGTTMNGAPCLLLDTRGRCSGQWRRTVLTYYGGDEGLMIAASNGGSDAHPLWYRNLLEIPDVRLRIGTQRFRATAEVLSAKERARVWPRLVAALPRFANYQARTGRKIPLVRLSPNETRPSSAPATPAC